MRDPEPPRAGLEGWSPQHATDVVDPSGRPVRVAHEVESVVGDVVTLTETTSDPDGTPLRVDRASLRFLEITTVARVERLGRRTSLVGMAVGTVCPGPV